MKTTAWMLRQDGEAFSVTVHPYCMQDPDLSSEADCATFIISTKSKDQDLAEYVLDCWMALMVIDQLDPDNEWTDDNTDIDALIEDGLSNLPYKFTAGLKNNQEYLDIHHKLNNFNNYSTWKVFFEEVNQNLTKIQDSIEHSINQQFCRVRYGGQYDTSAGDSEIWFRVSSVGYNWADTIYVFVSKVRRSLNLSSITVCRDYESDNHGFGDGEDYFYRAKDGEFYRHMPIDEYLNEEHEHSVVFSASPLGAGIYRRAKSLLSRGHTCYEIYANNMIDGQEIDQHLWNWFVRQEKQQHCVKASDFLENVSAKTASKLLRVKSKILKAYPEIEDLDIDGEPKENNNGNPVGIYYIFTLLSDTHDELNNKKIRIGYNKQYIPEDVIFRDFKMEYNHWRSKFLKTF